MDQEGAVRAAVRRVAWAKVNLSLHVTGRRSDGYHELDSLIVFAALCDELEIAPAPDLSLEVTGPFAGALRATRSVNNLVLKAARLLRKRHGVTAGARFRLDKRLPVAAGLGGGSADAAAALDGLLDLWELDLDRQDLTAVAAKIGADVPVCLTGRPSIIGGIGERVSPAPALPPAWLVLANPGVPLSTPAVFAARTGPFSAPAAWSGPIPDAAALAERLEGCRNDLETPAHALVPEIGLVLAALCETEGCLLARMSGSGATCFGLYGDQAAATAAARELDASQPGWWVRAAAMRGQSPDGA